MGCFSLFIDIPAALSCLRWLVRRRSSVAAVFLSFPLTGKDQRIKADIKGLPHLATAPPPCRPGPRAQPGWGLAFPHTAQGRKTALMDNSPALTVIAGPDPRSPSQQEGYPLVVASCHREARSDPFMTDLCKIYFLKHPFHFQLLTRQQTTTVDYKRLFNGLVLTRVASLQR